jgi:hypothetical protein
MGSAGESGEGLDRAKGAGARVDHMLSGFSEKAVSGMGGKLAARRTVLSAHFAILRALCG